MACRHIAIPISQRVVVYLKLSYPHNQSVTKSGWRISISLNGTPNPLCQMLAAATFDRNDGSRHSTNLPNSLQSKKAAPNLSVIRKQNGTRRMSRWARLSLSHQPHQTTTHKVLTVQANGFAHQPKICRKNGMTDPFEQVSGNLDYGAPLRG
jgi:hypothetical protein